MTLFFTTVNPQFKLGTETTTCWMYISIYKDLFLHLQGSSASTAGDSYVNFICNLILAWHAV